MDPLIILIAIVALALIFDFINGFHDTANAIATVVATKTLSPRMAVIFAGVLNFAGALMGTEVAATIGKGLVDQTSISMHIVFYALISSIIWNLFTWYKGMPTSSSHALIGSLLGATFFGSVAGHTHIHVGTVTNKIVLPMFISPVIGLIIGFLVMVALSWVVFKISLPNIKRIFGKLQIVSAGLMALSHGHNDAQKAMGIISLALVTMYPTSQFEVPLWVVLACATAMGLGTLSGGWRIIRTLGSKMVKLQPIHGFAAETTASTIIIGASYFGIPVSTTQVISSAILGVGATRRASAVKWGVVGSILVSWVFTIPVTFLLAGGLVLIHRLCFG